MLVMHANDMYRDLQEHILCVRVCVCVSVYNKVHSTPITVATIIQRCSYSSLCVCATCGDYSREWLFE